jgi:putative ABC transport system permease protein
MPEFAVLETLGYPNTSLMALVFAEAVIPCMAGAVFGTALADIVARLPMHYLPRGLSGISPPTLSAAVLAAAILCALVLAAAGAAIPMLKLRRMSVTDVLAGR